MKPDDVEWMLYDFWGRPASCDLPFKPTRKQLDELQQEVRAALRLDPLSAAEIAKNKNSVYLYTGCVVASKPVVLVLARPWDESPKQLDPRPLDYDNAVRRKVSDGGCRVWRTLRDESGLTVTCNGF